MTAATVTTSTTAAAKTNPYIMKAANVTTSTTAMIATTNKRAVDSSNTSMTQIVKRANVTLSQQSETSRNALSVIGMLKTNCLSCRLSHCSGNCLFKKLKLCYNCGGSHFNHQCPLRIGLRPRMLFEEKMKEKRICMSCYGKMDGEDHGWKYSPNRMLLCKMKERLKLMILIDYQKLLKTRRDLSLETYMCVDIHGSRETYNNYLASKYNI